MFLFTVLVIGDEDDDDDLEVEETKAKMDSYVELNDPTANNGGKDWFSVGQLFEAEEAYFYFEFEDEPDDWEEVELSFNFYVISETMQIDFHLVSPDWDELTINWINKPAKGGLIERFTVAAKGIYTIDISDVVEDLLDDDEEGISICISDNTTSNGYIQGTSVEGYYDKDDAPLLIWTYENSTILELDPKLIIAGTIIIVASAIGLAIGLYFGFFHKRKPVEPAKQTPQTSVQELPTEHAPAQLSIATPPTKYCPFCGIKLEMKTRFCSNCGGNID